MRKGHRDRSKLRNESQQSEKTRQRRRPNRECTESAWNRPRSNKNKFKRKPPAEKNADSKDCESKLKKPTNKCGRCGYDKTHKKCPAMGQQCGYCKKMYHYAKFCMAKEVHNLQVEDLEQETEEESD